MKKLYTLMISLLIGASAYAQWPENYGGVMLQGFYWNSFDDTKWTKLTEQADEYSKYFDAIWVPNSAYCTDGESMGYDPLYWFRHKSTFGSAKELKTMIKTYKDKGVSIIEDVVLNHRKGLYDYCDFPTESWNGETISWTLADICQNDDGGYTKEQGYDVTGANDTGDDFSGFRDLDHTSANVQKNVKLYLLYLLQELGYDGFRLDMVKGYAPEFTKLYNEAVSPKFCVGEFWDGYDAITWWIRGTGYTSAAFDFPLKYQLNKVFGSNDWAALGDKGIAGDPNYNRYSVTFIDNHDTYENESKLVGNELGANAAILAMPGTPCIFLKHWQSYPIAIGNMILARKAAGLTNQSEMIEQQAVDGGYVIKTKGTNGTVLFICGFPSYDTTGFKLIASGTNFAYFVSDNVEVTGLRDGNDFVEEGNISIYVEADQAPYLYAWNEGGELNGSWPGTQITETVQKDGKTFYKKTFDVSPVNIILNDGNGKQTGNIEGVLHDSYYTYDGTTSYIDITDNYYVIPDNELPLCVKPIDGHLYVYFQSNKDYDTPHVWVWNDTKNFCTTTTEWPGDAMKQVGSDTEGHAIYLWDGGELTSEMPTNIIFNNNGSPQSETFVFKNGNYYNIKGSMGNITTAVKPAFSKTSTSAATYNMAGQRVAPDYKGIVVTNGRKQLQK